MSGRAFEWAFKNLPFLRDASEKLVLLKLAHRADDEAAKCWPAVDTTAGDIGISRRSVLRALQNLEGLGLILVERRPNCSSIFTLQIKNSLSVGATVARQAQPASATAAHSRCHCVTEPVPPWHPNQTMNKTLKKTQQPVGVFKNLVWEKPLADSEKTACEFLLAAADLPTEVRQQLADEMAGIGRSQPIRNPVGWMKNMIDRYGRPGFSFAYSAQVAAGRAGRAAQAERENLALPPLLRSAPPPVRRPLSEAGRAELAKMGRRPKPAPPQVEATHAAANLTAAICQSAIAVTDLSGEATSAS